MSLKKLWNSLRGRAPQPETAAEPAAAAHRSVSIEKAAEVEKPKPGQSHARSAASPAATSSTTPSPSVSRPASASHAESANVAAAPAFAAPRRNVLSLLSRGEHDPLLRMIGENKPTSILEIGIGDGSRTPAILSMLCQAGCLPGAIKVIVIDEFELAGGDVTMRDYHRQLAGLTLRPVIFPEPVGRGLISVAHRFGAVDMVLLDVKASSTHAAELAALLGKVTHQRSVVLSNENGKWTARQPSEQQTRRAA